MRLVDTKVSLSSIHLGHPYSVYLGKQTAETGISVSNQQNISSHCTRQMFYVKDYFGQHHGWHSLSQQWVSSRCCGKMIHIGGVS